MKVAKASLLAILAHSAVARFVAEDEINRVQLYPAGSEPEKYLIELAQGDTRWVTEEEKWELRRVRRHRMHPVLLVY